MWLRNCEGRLSPRYSAERSRWNLRRSEAIVRSIIAAFTLSCGDETWDAHNRPATSAATSGGRTDTTCLHPVAWDVIPCQLELTFCLYKRDPLIRIPKMAKGARRNAGIVRWQSRGRGVFMPTAAMSVVYVRSGSPMWRPAADYRKDEVHSRTKVRN